MTISSLYNLSYSRIVLPQQNWKGTF